MIDQEVLDDLGQLWRRLRSGGVSLALMHDSRGLITKLPIYQAKISQALADMATQGGHRSPQESQSDARNLCRMAAGLLWAMRRFGFAGHDLALLHAGLGAAYFTRGRYDRALYRLRRSLPMLRKQMPPGHDFLLSLECAWANSELAVGRDVEILTDLDQVISRARAAGCNSTYLQNLETLRNSIYARTGQREHARTISQASLEDCKRRFGPESRESVEEMWRLALHVELPQGNVAGANELLSQCLHVFEENEGAVWVRPARAGVEMLAAEIERVSGNADEGIRHLKTAEYAARSNFPDRHPIVVEVTLRLANSLQDEGRCQEALEYLKHLANDLEDAAWLPPEQQARFSSIYTSCLMDSWEFVPFKDNYHNFFRNYKEEIRRRRNWPGEDIQLNNSQEIWNLIGLNLGILLVDSEGPGPDEIDEAFLHVIEFKGRVAEAVCVSREHRLAVLYPECHHDLEELAKIRKRLQQSGPDSSQTQNSQELLNEKRRIEDRLAEKIPEFSWQPPAIVDLASDLEDLHEDCALLDFVHIGPTPAEEPLFSSFAVFILPAGNPEYLQMIALDGANAIAAAIKNMREAQLESATLGRQYIETLETLWAQVWEPVESALDELRRVLPGRSFRRLFISPDHCLTWLPFQALRNPHWPPDRYLMDEYEISYLSTSRDIVNIPDLRARRGARPLAIGLNRIDVGYDGSVAAAHFEEFRPLREAEDQAQRVGKLLDGEVWKGERVTKESVFDHLGHVNSTQPRDQNYRSPAVIHFSSHGFVFGPYGEREVQQFHDTVQMDAIQQSLRRSGLALSGAWASLGALPSPAPVPPSLPGILNAYEISGLDLRDTQLVALAACKTGLGALSSGEGVFGLQRSFFVAGAHCLIMTLWPVEETVTTKLMESFYTQLCRGKSRSEALRYAQLQIRERFRHPAFWAGFICQGNPLPIAQIMHSENAIETQQATEQRT